MTKIKTSQIIDIQTYVDGKDNTVIGIASSDASVKSNQAEVNAKNYTDLEIASVNAETGLRLTTVLNDSKAYTDLKDIEGLTNSKTYTDNELTSHYKKVVVDQKFIDIDTLLTGKMSSKDSTVLTTANTNAQYWDTLVLQEAKQYTDASSGGAGGGEIGRLKYSDAYTDGVITGLNIINVIGLDGTLSNGVCYVNSIRQNILSQPNTYTANSDTYVDIDENGIFIYNTVNNGNMAPVVVGTNLRIVKVITNATDITTTINLAFRPKFYETDVEIKAAVQSDLDSKQNNLTFDTVPTFGSINPVESNGVFDAIKIVQDQLPSKQDNLIYDLIPTDTSTNPVYSNGIFNAIKIVQDQLPGKQDNLIYDLIPTATSTNNVLSDGIYNADQQILTTANSYSDTNLASELINVYKKNEHIIPPANYTYDIGSSSKQFKKIYSYYFYTKTALLSPSIYTSILRSYDNTQVKILNDIIPYTNEGQSIGLSNINRLNNIYCKTMLSDVSYINSITPNTSTALQINAPTIVNSSSLSMIGGDNFTFFNVKANDGFDAGVSFINSTTNDTWTIRNDSSDGNEFEWRFNNIGRLKIGSLTGNLISGGDNTSDLGSNSFRWKDIYASNAVIQTSDRNLKKDILTLEDNTVIAIMERLNPVSFKMIDGTRTHYGFIAQEVEAIHTELGIDIAWLIKSPKTIEVKTMKTYTEDVITYEDVEKTRMSKTLVEDENGKEVEIEYEETYTETIETVTPTTKEYEKITSELVPGEYTYGLRYQEFISLQARYSQILNDRLNSFEARLLALENNQVV